MKLIKFYILLLLFCCCKENNENKLLYNKLINYKAELKLQFENQDNYFRYNLTDNSFFQKRYDSLNKIQLKLDHYFERNRYKDRKNLIAIRDTFNTKFKLNLKLIKPNDYQNISDTLFKRLIETEFLQLKVEFQSRYMLDRGCR